MQRFVSHVFLEPSKRTGRMDHGTVSKAVLVPAVWVKCCYHSASVHTQDCNPFVMLDVLFSSSVAVIEFFG